VLQRSGLFLVGFSSSGRSFPRHRFRNFATSRYARAFILDDPSWLANYPFNQICPATNNTTPIITIEGHRYMDGGCYSIDHADLAGGFDRVLILSLKAGVPPSCVVSLDAALETLRRNGAQVVVVRPDEATEAAFAAASGNLLAPSVREGAACASREQGRRIANLSVTSLWR
jgi:hypothetical protein